MGSESKYMPGTLLWSKIGNYPFWPSMISYDPSTGQCFKEKKARGKPKLIYHVQFFGQSVEHGWTSPGRIFLFDGTGESGFNKKKEALLRQACGKAAKKNIQVMFNVPEVRRASWNLAIEEALEAHKISNIEERFATHVFMYETADKKAKSKTAPISCDFSERKGADQPQIERAKRKNSNDSLEELHPVKKIKHNDVKLTSEIKMRIKKKKMLSDGDFDDVCKICKKDMVDFSCSGNCLQSYHIGCVGLLSVPKVFKCSECDSGNFACFICKKSNGLIKKCKYSKCRKFYHDKCLNKYCYTRIRNSSSDKICGFHSCLTCYSENAENIMSFKGPFLRCFFCPTAFHNRDSCIAAGSKYLSETTILCPDHLNQTSKSTTFINTSKCMICEQGGELICCETCPQAYHAECLNDPIPTSAYFCSDCSSRKPLSYGMIVLGKTGCYRFWPAMIISPDEVPENVRNIPHNEGEFVIKYFGTGDYTWTHKGRLLPYSEDSKNIRVYKKNRMDIRYIQSFQDADAAFRNYQTARCSLNDKPEAYKHIRVNKAIPPAIILYSYPDTDPCDCRKENSSCNTHLCINRSTRVECVPETCTAVDECQNQKFVKKQYPKLKIIKTVNRGYGLATEEKIKKGQFIIEYVGEVITTEEYERRCKDMRDRHKKNYYFLYLDSKRLIDAGPSGNLSRFINHSCEPNCELQKWKVIGDSRVGIFALTDLEPGDELLFNYGPKTFEFKDSCRCGSESCYINISIEPKNNKKKKKTFSQTSNTSSSAIQSSNADPHPSMLPIAVVLLKKLSPEKIAEYYPGPSSASGATSLSSKSKLAKLKMDTEQAQRVKDVSCQPNKKQNTKSCVNLQPSSSVALVSLKSRKRLSNLYENNIHQPEKINDVEPVLDSETSSVVEFDDTVHEDFLPLSAESVSAEYDPASPVSTSSVPYLKTSETIPCSESNKFVTEANIENLCINHSAQNALSTELNSNILKTVNEESVNSDDLSAFCESFAPELFLTEDIPENCTDLELELQQMIVQPSMDISNENIFASHLCPDAVQIETEYDKPNLNSFSDNFNSITVQDSMNSKSFDEMAPETNELCFKCMEAGADIRCTIDFCKEWYHLKCIEDPKQGDFVCSLHKCSNCEKLLRKLANKSSNKL